MNDHHLVLGHIKDIITGETIVETHDEQFRQNIARQLVTRLGFEKKEILPKHKLRLAFDNKSALILIDFIIRMSEKTLMLIKYGPGSLITRHRMALGLSRLVEPYQIPFVVVTNGRDADILDGKTGTVMFSGLDTIPSKPEVARILTTETFQPLSEKQREMASRIVYAFEIDDKCPCDDTNTCLLD